MLYWMNDLTGEAVALNDGVHPGEGWFEISPEDYDVARKAKRANTGIEPTMEGFDKLLNILDLMAKVESHEKAAHA
jgi:hypothetical protein